MAHQTEDRGLQTLLQGISYSDEHEEDRIFFHTQKRFTFMSPEDLPKTNGVISDPHFPRCYCEFIDVDALIERGTPTLETIPEEAYLDTFQY